MNSTKNSTKKDGPLNQTELVVVLVTTFLLPVISGAIYYYGWKGSLPVKAKQANKYSWIMAVVAVVMFFMFGGRI